MLPFFSTGYSDQMLFFNSMSGVLLVLDGPDASGTTTQARLLAEALRKMGKDVTETSEPSAGKVGKMIREMLQSAEVVSPEALQLLFTADRADHVATVIEPALKAGKVVVCDRYVPSTLVYGELQGLSTAWLQAISATFPKPTVTIFTLPPIEVSLKRLEKRAGKEFFETEAQQRKIHELYHKLAKSDSSIVLLDTSGEKENTLKILLTVVQKHLV